MLRRCSDVWKEIHEWLTLTDAQLAVGTSNPVDFCWNHIFLACDRNIFWENSSKASAVIYFKIRLTFPADKDG